MALKVVVAGLGARGREWVREVKAAPAYELVGCSDIDPNVLHDAGAALNIPAKSCFLDLREAIERTNCAAVIVATPADRHTEACHAALSRGIAVLVEKPFTVNLKDALALYLPRCSRSGIGRSGRGQRSEPADD